MFSSAVLCGTYTGGMQSARQQRDVRQRCCLCSLLSHEASSRYTMGQEAVDVYYKSKRSDNYSHPNTTILMASWTHSVSSDGIRFFCLISSHRPLLSPTPLFFLTRPPFAPQMFSFSPSDSDTKHTQDTSVASASSSLISARSRLRLIIFRCPDQPSD